MEAAGGTGGGVVRDLAVGLCVQTGFGIVARRWGQKGGGNSRMLPLADGDVEGDTGHVLLERLIKLSTLVILQRSREDGGEQESMGRVHELNALKCNHVWTAMSEWRVTATGARGSASSLRARPSARLPVSCGGARRQAFCAVSMCR